MVAIHFFSQVVMKISWLTDIHLEWLNQKSRKIFFEAIADEHPDVILLGGDICNSANLEPWLLKLYKKVQAPIYFCLGNHDITRPVFWKFGS
jgi:predicted MPP superfamily phosphohydrolase